jgi:hypothetical protein
MVLSVNLDVPWEQYGNDCKGGACRHWLLRRLPLALLSLLAHEENGEDLGDDVWPTHGRWQIFDCGDVWICVECRR